MHKNIAQTIVLPVNGSTFELKFQLHAGLDDEIFLKFERPPQETDWFYTFNSADIRLRKPFPNKQYVVRGKLLPDSWRTFY